MRCKAMKAIFWAAGATEVGKGWPLINVSAPCLLLLNASASNSDSDGISVAVASPDNNAAGPRLIVGLSGFAAGLQCAGVGVASGGGAVPLASASTADGAVVDVLLPTGDLMGQTVAFRCVRSHLPQG